MNNSLLISDLRLSEARPELVAAFSEYCQSIAHDTDELFILGDLADAWTGGNQDDSNTAKLIRNALSALTVAGVNIYLLIRDADILESQDFAQICGVNLMRDPSFEAFDGQTLLVHGETMRLADSDYKAFVEQIQNPQMQQMLQSKPIAERRQNAALIYARKKAAYETQSEAGLEESTCKLDYVS